MQIEKKLVEKYSNFALLSILLFIFLLLYFTFIALRFKPIDINELDSLGQHIPLAESILDGNLFNPPSLQKGLGYYLPIGEIILSVFMFLNIPLGFYNILALIILFYLCYKLALVVGIKKPLSLICSFSIVYLNSIVRLIPTQKNDIWLDVFFVWILYLLQKPKNNIKYFLLLGISAGLLVGVKYSGILLFLILFSVYFKNLRKVISRENVFALLLPFVGLGLIWFVRNYILTNNPFYPVSIFTFTGHPEFMVPKGYENFLSVDSLKMAIEAFISEYLLWSIIPIYLSYNIFIKGLKIKRDVKYFLLASLLSTIIYFIGPTDFTRVNITSNMRFLHPGLILLVLSAFLIAIKLNKEKELVIFSILSSVTVLSQFSYYPKLVIIWLFISFLILNSRLRLFLDKQ